MIGLDPHAIKELKKVFEELRDSGMVLVSTHMIDSMEELWDTTYIMKQGRVAAVVERENLKDNHKSLEDIFFEITRGTYHCNCHGYGGFRQIKYFSKFFSCN